MRHFNWLGYIAASVSSSIVGLFLIYAMALFQKREAVLGIDLIIDATIEDLFKDYISHLPLMILMMTIIALLGCILAIKYVRKLNVKSPYYFSVGGALYAVFCYLLMIVFTGFESSIEMFISAAITGFIGGMTYGVSQYKILYK